MGAVEKAQIDAAAWMAHSLPIAPPPPDAIGLARAVSRVLSMVADDLTGVVAELNANALDDALAQHALGVVTGALGVLDGMAGAPEA